MTAEPIERRLGRLLEEQALLARVSRAASSSLDLNQICGSISDVLRDVIPFDRLAFSVPDQARATVTPMAVVGPPAGFQPGASAPYAGTMVEEACRTRAPVLAQGDLDSVVMRFPPLANLTHAGFLSTLVIPLVAGDRVIACLVLSSRTASAYSDDHVRLAQWIGDQLGGAVANALTTIALSDEHELVVRLSYPVLPLREDMLLIRVIGMLDSRRVHLLRERALAAIRRHRARVVILDVTAMADISPVVVGDLIHTIEACRLLGAKVVVTGITSEAARRMVGMAPDIRDLKTVGDLQAGIAEAMRLAGRPDKNASSVMNARG